LAHIGKNDTHAEGAARELMNVLDALGTSLEEILLPALRENSHWRPCLEALRKERLRVTGARYVAHSEGELDVDMQGQARVIPHADDIIDTDLLHGSQQRIQVQVVLPQIQGKIDAIMGKKNLCLAELACVQQFGYETVAPFIQRVWRGVLQRCERLRVLRQLAFEMRHAAATQMQAWLRARQTSWKFADNKGAKLFEMHSLWAVRLQKHVRRFTARSRYRRWKDWKDDRFIFATVQKFQALIRGFIARRRVGKTKAHNAEEREKDLQRWGVTSIQAYSPLLYLFIYLFISFFFLSFFLFSFFFLTQY
jgi:hypothetical protein